MKALRLARVGVVGMVRGVAVVGVEKSSRWLALSPNLAYALKP